MTLAKTGFGCILGALLLSYSLFCFELDSVFFLRVLSSSFSSCSMSTFQSLYVFQSDLMQFHFYFTLCLSSIAVQATNANDRTKSMAKPLKCCVLQKHR